MLYNTGKNNGFPFLDNFGYLKNTHKNPKFGRVRQVQSGNLVGNSLVGTCLTLPNLGFLWVFFKYPKISKMGIRYFFLCNMCHMLCYITFLMLCYITHVMLCYITSVKCCVI